MKMPVPPFLVTYGYIVVATTMLLSVAVAETSSGGDAGSIEHWRAPSTENQENHLSPHTDGYLPPFAEVGRFTGAMVCTAAIVLHPRIIVTAGHCVAERNGAAARSRLFFQPGYHDGTDLGRFSATVWGLGSQQRFRSQSVRDASNDWAILVLDRAPIGIHPFSLSSQAADELRQHVRQILMPSYSIDAAGALSLSINPACSVRDLTWNVLVHDCKASAGASGAPLLIPDQRWYALIGIHSGSMFAASEEGHRPAKFIGNSAIGTWTFVDAVQMLARRLNNGDNVDGVGSFGY